MNHATPAVPDITEIQSRFKAEFGRLKALKIHYTAQDVHACLQAFSERRDDVQASIDAILNSIEYAQRRDDPPRIGYAIHSTRYRIKDYMHVADKVLRKSLQSKGQRLITPATLFGKDGLMDLGGIRILHVRRGSWKIIHTYLTDRRRQWAVIEKKGYIRDGQQSEYKEEGRFAKSQLVTHRGGAPIRYTSLHYVIKPHRESGSGLPVECQVRTIFEEGWAEIDHELNYPHEAPPAFGRQLSVLNTAANTANEIASALESLEHLPKFVPWSIEQEMELQAEEVYCLSHKLNWFSASDSEALYNHFKSGPDVKFRYYVLDDSDDTKGRAKEIIENFRRREITNISFHFVPEVFKGKLPFLSDLLLLRGIYENAKNPAQDVVVMGTLIRSNKDRPRHKEEELDILIDDPESVRTVSEFFADLRNYFENESPGTFGRTDNDSDPVP